MNFSKKNNGKTPVAAMIDTAQGKESAEKGAGKRLTCPLSFHRAQRDAASGQVRQPGYYFLNGLTSTTQAAVIPSPCRWDTYLHEIDFSKKYKMNF
jgi:hypothetical protein